MNAGSAISALNWLVIWYRADVVSLKNNKLEAIDGKTRKLLNIHRVFDSKEDVDWLYFPWKIGDLKVP